MTSAWLEDQELRPGGLVRLGDGPHVFTLELDDGDDSSLVIPIDDADEKPSVTMWIVLVALSILSLAVALFMRS